MTDHQAVATVLARELEGRQPRIGIILGSGLGDLAERITDAVRIPFSAVPTMPRSTVAGHTGQFVGGRLGSKDVIAMQGRLHSYEGHPYPVLALPVRAMRAIGVEVLFISNAAGSLRADMLPGSLMAISDHLNWSGFNPLMGPNDDAVGPRFIDMSNAYDRDLRAALHRAASDEGISLREGVYAWYSGPNFETPAEIRAFRILGADAVGMSTVPECISAVHCGMRVVAVSAITNLAAGMDRTTLSHEHTLAESRKLSESFCQLVERFVRNAPVSPASAPVIAARAAAR